MAKGDDKKKDEKKKKKEDKQTRGKKGGKSNEQTLNEATYNKLWCFDLAMEQVRDGFFSFFISDSPGSGEVCGRKNEQLVSCAN